MARTSARPPGNDFTPQQDRPAAGNGLKPAQHLRTRRSALSGYHPRMIMDPLPKIETTRLVLRQLAGSDADALFQIFGDPDVMRYWSSPPLQSLEDARKLLENIDQGRTSSTLFQWGIELIETGRVIGTATLYGWDRAHARASIGYALRQDHWRRGFVTEAIRGLIRFAFDELQLHRLEADVDPNNEASVRSLERLGFLREGHQRERYWMLGAWQDSWMYGLLRHEWRAREGGAARWD